MFHSLKGKIISIYFFLIFLICFIAIISILSLYNLNKAIDGLMESNYRSIVAANNMIDAIERQDSNQLIYLQGNTNEGLKSHTNNQKEFFTWLSKARDNITEEGEPEIINSITENYLYYLESFSELQSIYSLGNQKQAFIFYDNTINPVFLKVKESCLNLAQLNEVAMFNSKNKAMVNSRNQMYTTIFISIFFILLGLLVAFYFTKRTMQPMHKLILGVKSIKEGNLSQEIQVISKDEIGQLAIEFNNMSRRLLQYEESNIKNLIAEKNKSLAIVKSISDPIIVTDNELKIILVNNAAEIVFKISEKDVIGKHFLEAINNRDIFDRIKKIINGVELSEEDKTNQIIIEQEDKNLFYILTVSSIYNDDNCIMGSVSVLQDITSMKKVEQLKSDFISTVSHELRTPLTSIIMGTGIILDENSGKLNNEQKEIMQVIEEDGERLIDIVNDLLDLSRIESGKMVLNLEKVSIYKLVENCIGSLMEIARNRGIKLYNKIPEDVPFVLGDAKKIFYVLNNLITNAIKFTEKDGEIVISSLIEKNYLKISVKDTGIGIPEEYQDLIFDKYMQYWNERNNNNGTGLGLAITKEFINKQNGEIWVESKPGEGSNFIFTLPLFERW